MKGAGGRGDDGVLGDRVVLVGPGGPDPVGDVAGRLEVRLQVADRHRVLPHIS